MYNDEDYYDINRIHSYSEPQNNIGNIVQTPSICQKCENSYIKCSICDGYFTVEHFYNEHQGMCNLIHAVYKERENLIECEHCFTFFLIEEMQLHYENCNKSPTEDSANNVHMALNQDRNHVQEKLKCAFCFELISSGLLEDHERACKEIQSGMLLFHETIQCEFCFRNVTLPEIQFHETSCLQLKQKQEMIEKKVNLKEIELPIEWQNDTAHTKIIDENLSLITLDRNKDTFKYLVDLTNMSGCKVNVTNIYRIQNRFLWHKYSKEKARVVEEKGATEENWLFHGTRANNPKSLYHIGFDISYSSDQGSFGRGIYFARQSVYSLSGYCYVDKQGKGYVFLAKVITGNAFVAGSASGFAGPGIKKAPFMDEQKCIRYDSVTNAKNTDQHVSQMYIVYENDKAYPFYLIEFTYSNNINQIRNYNKNMMLQPMVISKTSQNQQSNEDDEVI